MRVSTKQPEQASRLPTQRACLGTRGQRAAEAGNTGHENEKGPLTGHLNCFSRPSFFLWTETEGGGARSGVRASGRLRAMGSRRAEAYCFADRCGPAGRLRSLGVRSRSECESRDGGGVVGRGLWTVKREGGRQRGSPRVGEGKHEVVALDGTDRGE